MLAEAIKPLNVDCLTDSEWRQTRPTASADTGQLAARETRGTPPTHRAAALTLQPGSPSTTSWYVPTIMAVAEVMRFPRNWDSYGAPRIEGPLVRAAMNLLTSVMRDDTPAPAVVPTSRGGIQFEWHARGIDLEVEFLSPVRIQVLFEDHRDNVSWEQDLNINVKPLTEAIARLSRR